METKRFLVVLGMVITSVVLGGIWIISNSLSEQSKLYYELQINESRANYNEAMNLTLQQFTKTNNKSERIHDYVFDNITELKKDLDPVLATIENATQMRIDQDNHYAQDKIEFGVIENVSELLQAYSNGTERVAKEVKHHGLLVEINQTLSDFVNGNNNNSGSSTEIQPPIINNVTQEEDRGLSPSN